MDLGAVLLHLEAQRRHCADALQREEELRIEQRQREVDRGAARQAAAEERAAQADTRHQPQLAAFVAASNQARSAVGSYAVGRALASAIPVFTGDHDGTADCGTYLRTLERLFLLLLPARLGPPRHRRPASLSRDDRHGPPGRAAGPDRERTFTMEPTHETHAPGSTELDNSHYAAE